MRQFFEQKLSTYFKTRQDKTRQDKAGNHHDTFALEHVFAELCDLLEQAQLRLAGLFFNADKNFDVSNLRQACAVRDIEANIPRNRRSAD